MTAKKDGYLGNPNLKPVGVQQQFTPEQVQEYIKCATDPVYFVEKYVKIVAVDKGLVPFEMYDFQKDLIDKLHKNRFVIGKLPRQVGKALPLYTKIPTPTGWTTMESLQVGDYIFGNDGLPTKVIFKTDTMYNHECFKLTFDNGEEIDADGEHLWTVSSANWDHKQKIVTTNELLEYMKNNYTKGGRIYINTCSPLDLPEQQLEIPPYLLGLWLGDGYSSSGRIISHKDDYNEYKTTLESMGEVIQHERVENNCIVFTIKNLHTRLNQLNILNNKHIPQKYLRASFSQRMELLRGLMDTDGSSSNKKRTFEFYQKQSSLFENVVELISTLGIKTRTNFKSINGRIYNTCRYTTELDVFKLNRKLNKAPNAKPSRSQDKRIYINSIEKIDSVPVACIKVDNQSSLFLVGNKFIPTHNTTTVGSYLLHYVLFNQNMNVAILANKQSTAIEILGRIKMAYEYLPKWLQQGVIEWNKGSIVLENGSRILAAATSSSAIRGGSFNCILLDEFAHIPTQIAEEFFTSVYPTITSGQSTKMFIISTPNGLNMFYYYWKGAINNQNGYVPFEVHWSQVPKYPGGPLRDDQWKRDMISKTSEKQFEQEFECDFLGSSNTLISADKLHTLVYSKPLLRTKDGMCVYQEPVRKDAENEKSQDHLYFITADVAEGQGKDYTAMTVIDVTQFPYKVVAVYRNNTVSPLLFASVLKTVAKKYNNAHVLIEVNSIGMEVANILHTDLEYENIVKTAMMGRKGQIITEGYGPVKKVQMGVKTSVLTKKIGCQVLKNLIEEDKLIVEDVDIISEFTTFISKKQSFEAEDGHNDDLVMCLVLFSWATRQQYFKNLTDMDVRLAMYHQEIEKIEDDMLPFGYYMDGNVDPDDEEDDKLWSYGNEKWIINTKENVNLPWNTYNK